MDDARSSIKQITSPCIINIALNNPLTFLALAALLLENLMPRVRLRLIPGPFYLFSKELGTDMTVLSHVVLLELHGDLFSRHARSVTMVVT